MLLQKARADGGFGHAGDLHALVARFLPGHDRDGAARHTQRVREERDERVVGGAVDRRRGEPYQDGAAALSVHPRPWRTRDHAHAEDR